MCEFLILSPHDISNRNTVHTGSELQQNKVKFALEQAMKAQKGSTGIDLHFLEPRR
jgi:hypothetical protein